MNITVVEVEAGGITTLEITTPGPRGFGVPLGGTTAQVLRKASNTDLDTEWHTLAKADVGLSSVDNTSDANKPISTATQTALDAKEPTITVGTTSQYWRGDKSWSDFMTDVRAAVLTGLSTASSAAVSAVDSVLVAIGKLQAQITANLSSLTTHIADVANPHAVTKTQVGLGNVDNTSDANKPVSTATQTALDLKANLSLVGSASGIAPLDSGGKVASSYLPSTDAVTEGSTNLYFTEPRVRGTVLTGLSTAAGTVVTAAHTVLQALGFLQKQVSDNTTAISGKQASDATLTSIAALGTAADKVAYTTGVDTWAETPFTSAARALLDDVDAPAMLITLGALANAGIATWTPTISASGGGVGTYTVQVGRYLAIGNLIIATAYVGFDINTLTGNLSISLPVTSENVTNSYVMGLCTYWGGFATSMTRIGGFAAPNSSTFALHKMTAAAGSSSTALANTDCDASQEFMFVFAYFKP